MSDSFDLNQIAAILVDKWTKDILTTAATPIAGMRKRGMQKNAMKRAIAAEVKFRASVFTLISRDRSQQLSKIFVPLNIRHNRQVRECPTFSELKRQSPHTLIVGTGGSGKSMLMRHFYVQAAAQENNSFPFFIDLKSLNDKATKVVEAVAAECSRYGADIEPAAVVRLLQNGRISLFLDGFDELATSRSLQIQTEIMHLAKAAPDAAIFVSSRPDHQFVGWPTFEQVEPQLLTLDQAVELVNRSGFNTRVAGRFVKQLNEGMYAQHRPLLSNPLLLTIMLISYEHGAGLPEKRHIFYFQAFEAMFWKHDATKDGFRREICSELPRDDFQQILEGMAFVLYGCGQIAFDKDQLVSAIDTSARIAGLALTPDEFIRDLVRGVCMIVVEGQQYSFVHRSFQEYFVARFIRTLAPDERRQFLRDIAARWPRDAVLDMAYEMDKFEIERDLIVPTLTTVVGFGRPGRTLLQTRVSVARWVGWRISYDFAARRLYIMVSSPASGGYGILRFIEDKYKTCQSGRISDTKLKAVAKVFLEVCAESGWNPEHGIDGAVAVTSDRLVEAMSANDLWILTEEVIERFGKVKNSLERNHGQRSTVVEEIIQRRLARPDV